MITEQDMDDAYGGQFLSARELGDQKIRAIIARVYMQDLRQQDGGTKRRAILEFTNGTKDLPLNKTNYNYLVNVTGSKSLAGAVGSEVGIFTISTPKGPGLSLRLLKPANAPAPAEPPEVDDAIPF